MPEKRKKSRGGSESVKEKTLLVHPFPPLYDSESKVLILGSFPSVVSREQNFYYANRTNRFWPLLAQLFEETIPKTTEERTAFCHRHHIALWDVIESCTIHGSSDASISDVTVNEIDALAEKTGITAVFTTGRKASELFERHVRTRLKHIALPSTSAANARMRMEDLKREYQVIRDYAEKD